MWSPFEQHTDVRFRPPFEANPRHQGPAAYTAHQLKDVPTFSGSSSKKHGLQVEDWARDMRFLLELKGPQPERVRFQEVVCHTKADARDIVLNLESRGTLCRGSHLGAH